MKRTVNEQVRRGSTTDEKYNNLATDAIGDGLSRCECCGEINQSYSLAAVRFAGSRHVTTMLCGTCYDVRAQIGMRTREYVSLAQIRGGRNAAHAS
jgi:hypothetical protein